MTSSFLITPATRDQVTSLPSVLHRRRRDNRSSTALFFVNPDASETIISFDKLYYEANRYAHALRSQGIAPKSVVILTMSHSPSLLYAFWGVLLLGAIPAIFPPLTEKLAPEMYYERVRGMAVHSGAGLIVTDGALHAPLTNLLHDTPIRVMQIDDLGESNPTEQIDINVNPDSTALLQHSSGTTGLQKGVALPHRAILNQIASYSAAMELAADDKVVSWLPLYHDMGLIAGFILPILQGIPLVLISPFQWVRDPRLLLTLIERHRATLCWLPNFAYNLMAERASRLVPGEVDLSSIRAFVNCSEPVQAESHRRFIGRFTNFGLRADVLTVCYAMAENTFAVTQTPPGTAPTIERLSRMKLAQNRAELATGDELAVEVVSCGRPMLNCDVQIRDSALAVLADRQIGEIAIRSNSMLSAYHNRPELTENVMVDGWYLTGDLGYMADGDLYITGRKKDILIVGGKNIYPQDIEAIVNDIPGVYPGRVVAFAIPDARLGTEAVVVVCEVETTDSDVRTEIERVIRTSIAQQIDITLYDVLLVARKWLHKTSSGKIARAANREKYLDYVHNGTMG